MSSKIEESTEYLHLIAEGIPKDAAWSATWIDRAYKCLVKNGMDGATAYSQAVSAFAANALNFESLAPERVMYLVLEKAFEAQKEFPKLDPEQPEASYFLRQRSGDDRKPS